MNRRTFHHVLAGAAALRTFRGEEPGQFRATWESIRTHTVPAWYPNAKLGIFIHWGLYSVPAWAPHGGGIYQQGAEKGWQSMFAKKPYAGRDLKTFRAGGTPTRRYPPANHVPKFSYDAFAP